MLSIFLTNWLWIPVIIHYDVAVRRLVRRSAVRAVPLSGDHL